jgi:Short C-terminal domain
MQSEDDTDQSTLNFKANRLAPDRGIASMAMPNELNVLADRVESRRPSLIGRHDVRGIPFDQVAQVRVKRGIPFCQITIESTGGHAIVVGGLRRNDAEEAKFAIEQRMEATRNRQPAKHRSAPSSQADEIERLADLKERGVLSVTEFEAAKKKLLGL